MYIDFHNHLDFYKEDELKEAIEDINKNDIKVISCGMDIKSYEYNLDIKSQSENIIPTFGVHPWKVSKDTNDLQRFDKYIKESKLIGEVGLDFYWAEDKSSYGKQVEVFKYFLKKAKEHGKYINIHTKGAEDIVYSLLKEYDVSENSIIHWYSGDMDTLKKLVDAKCYFTASVDLKYSDLSREIAKYIPKDKLLGETDGPTALEWVNGKYGMPSEIINVYKNICDIKNIELGEFIESTNLVYNKITEKFL